MNVDLRVSSVEMGRAIQKAGLMEKAAVNAISQAVVRDSEPYVPRLTGDLRDTGRSETDYEQGKVRYGNANVVYARPQYEAPGGWGYTTPGTGPEWYEEAKNAHMDQWIDEGEQAVKEAAGR